jgi:hypothetical protein
MGQSTETGKIQDSNQKLGTPASRAGFGVRQAGEGNSSFSLVVVLFFGTLCLSKMRIICNQCAMVVNEGQFIVSLGLSLNDGRNCCSPTGLHNYVLTTGNNVQLAHNKNLIASSRIDGGCRRETFQEAEKDDSPRDRYQQLH